MSGAAPGAPGQQPATYRLPPIPSRHREASRQMILRVAEGVSPARAIVLGAGPCDEIPVVELATRFSELVLNDIDPRTVATALDTLEIDQIARAKIRCDAADLTGATEPALARVDAALSTAGDVHQALDGMAAALAGQPAVGLTLAGPWATGSCDLVVASCLLSQLHFHLAHGAAARFEACYPGQGELLRKSEAWTRSLDELARRIEGRFVEDLAQLVAPGGRVYLSESVQMCYVTRVADGGWTSPGTYRMLQTKDLADYVRGKFTVVERDRWEWVVNAPAKTGDVGRLFDVQALVLARQ